MPTELKEIKDHYNARRNLRTEIRRKLKTLAPPPRIPLSDWCDEHRILAKEINAVGGRWDTSTAPYQKEMLDVAGDWNHKEIVFCTSAQVGKTSVLENVIAYYIINDPGPIMVVFPESSTLRAFSQDRIDTMVRDMPDLRERVDPKRSRDKANTISYKKFEGGHITFATAGSARQLRSRPIRYLFCDEIDAYDLNISGEGDPIRLAKARTDTFFNKKVILTSTPTDEDTSRVWKAFKDSDQRFFYVPCPHCGTEQILVFGSLSQFFEEGKTGQLRWEENTPQTAYYECVKGCRIEQYEKTNMLRKGKWIAREPNAIVAGFFINSLYSPWVQWSDLAQEFLECKRDPYQLQVFVNTKLGEVWRERASIQASDLVTHCRAYEAPCPSGVGVITAGVDVQMNRLEVYFWGWGDGEQSWFLDHQIIWKDPAEEAAWYDLERVLSRTFRTRNKAEVRCHAVAIDTGYMGELVRRFVSRIRRKRVYAVVGINKYGSPILNKPRKSKENILTWPVGTDSAKKLLMARLKITEQGPGYVNFPLNTDINLRDVFYQITSEKPVSKIQGGRRIVVFEKRHAHARNEALDCWVYAYAALLNIGVGVVDKLGEYAAQIERKTPADKEKESEKTESKEKRSPDPSQEFVRKKMRHFSPRNTNWQTGWGDGYGKF